MKVDTKWENWNSDPPGGLNYLVIRVVKRTKQIYQIERNAIVATIKYSAAWSMCQKGHYPVPEEDSFKIWVLHLCDGLAYQMLFDFYASWHISKVDQYLALVGTRIFKTKT